MNYKKLTKIADAMFQQRQMFKDMAQEFENISSTLKVDAKFFRDEEYMDNIDVETLGKTVHALRGCADTLDNILADLEKLYDQKHDELWNS